MSTDMSFEEFRDACRAAMSKRYELVYVSQGDKLTDEQVDALVSRDWETLDETMEHWLPDARYSGMDHERNELIRDVSEAMYREGRITDLETFRDAFASSDEFEALRWDIEDRDDSNPIRDLADMTGPVLMRQLIVHEDASDDITGPVSVLRALVNDAEAGTVVRQNLHNIGVARETLDECGTGVRLVGIVYSLDTSELFDADGEFVDIVGPSLFVGNPFTGAGWVSDTPLKGSVRIKRDELTTDRSAFGYSWKETAGVYESAYPATLVNVPATPDTDA